MCNLNGGNNKWLIDLSTHLILLAVILCYKTHYAYVIEFLYAPLLFARLLFRETMTC